MTDVAFDWVALAPLADVWQALADEYARCGWTCSWFGQDVENVAVQMAGVAVPEHAMFFVTLQGFQDDQTHVRLQPEVSTNGDTLSIIADHSYTVLHHAGWMPSNSALYDVPPRFFRPLRFRPRSHSS